MSVCEFRQYNVYYSGINRVDNAHLEIAGYRFANGSQEGTLYPKTQDCYSCHEQNGAVDTTFVQYYPTLVDLAKAKGTFKSAGQ